MNKLDQFLQIWGADPGTSPGGLVRVTVPVSDLSDFCEAARFELDARLAMMTARDAFPATDRFILVCVLHVPDDPRYLLISAPLGSGENSFPSLCPVFTNANWPEREIRDMFGLVPLGHPDPRPLIWKGGWPRDRFPLRKDFTRDPDFQINRVLHPVCTVDGEGTCEVPVGPIHAGIIEPGHFRFQIVGDTMLGLDAQMFFCHRGIEKKAEGMVPYQAILLSERQCGTCSVSNALSFCLAVERAAGAEIPPRARMLRVVMSELERLYNHANDVAAIAAGVGFAFLTQQGLRIKEEMQRDFEALCGHRFLRNVLVPGGMRQDFEKGNLLGLLERVDHAMKDLRDAVSPAFRHSIYLDRLETTGVLTRKNAVALRAVGPAARASGIPADTRVDHPYDGYGELPKFQVPTRPAGDVMSRFRLRLDEIPQSLALLGEAVKALPEGPTRVSLPPLPEGSWGLGATESARGENLFLVRFGDGGRIDRYAVRTASYCNWPCIPTTVRGNIVPDFPLINKSFELCYADVDR